jgi:hypothetical protein
VPEALVRFTAAGHIRFGIGGDSDGDLSEDTQNEYLPVIVVPISAATTYYRKFFVENLDIVPFYKWKVAVVSNRREVTAEIGFDPNPQNYIRNAQTPPAGVTTWRTEIKGNDINVPLFEPQAPLTFWLKITTSPDVERHSSYTVGLKFEGYS